MNKHKKKISLTGVVIVVLLLLLPVSYAAYTSVTSARRVVSTAGGADVLFSSNYLPTLLQEEMEGNSKGEKYKNIPISYQVNSTNTTQAVYVSVCNYAQGYPTEWSDQDITYHIKFTLVDRENHETIEQNKTYTDKSGKEVSGSEILKKEFKVSKGIVSSTSGTVSIPITYDGQKLEATGTVSQNMYTVFLDTTYADIVGVKIEVLTENNSPAYSGYGLGGVLYLNGYETEATTGWSGEIQEGSGTNSKKSTEYTGFNYEVSGSGAGTVQVTWDKDQFAISKIFLADMEQYLVKDDSNNGSISFKVGEADQGDRFFIQFYRVGQPKQDVSWDNLKEKFDCKFTSSEATE